MFINRFNKVRILVTVLLFAINSAIHAQQENLAISKFQILDDFRNNPALAGYWGRPVAGAYFDGFLKEQVLPSYSFGGYFNIGLRKSGLAVEINTKQDLNNWSLNGQYSYSRAFKLSDKLTLRLGGGLQVTEMISKSFGSHTFADEINTFSSSMEPRPNSGLTFLLTGNAGFSLYSRKFLVAVGGKNLLPLFQYNDFQNEFNFFNARMYGYAPPELRATFAYEIALGEDFRLSPAVSLKHVVNIPQPYPEAHLNLLWRNLAMLNLNYNPQGTIKIMAGIQVAEKYRISAGVNQFNNSDLSTFHEGQRFQFSILTQF